MITNPITGDEQPNMRSVFLTIGGSRRNRNGYWRAGWAVYYGRDSFNNSSGVIPDSLPQSASFAEIQALKHALISIRNLLAIGYWFSNIHIRTTSTYLADMMAGGLEDCVLNGWKHEDGTYLEHTESWEWIRELLREVQQISRGQANLHISHVGQGMNQGATLLACRTIDRFNQTGETQNNLEI
jgi:ribonuclease HI